MGQYIDHFYVVEDLQTRGQLQISEYPDLHTAIQAYRTLPKSRMKALGAQNNCPMPGSLDLVQCIRGVNIIVQDYRRVNGWQCKEVSEALRTIRKSMRTKEGMESRFVDVTGYELFRIPDGECVVLMNRMERYVHPCEYIDPYHFRVGSMVFHCNEFAERCLKAGNVFLPEHPRPGDMLDTYEVYQIQHPIDCDYAYLPYDQAEGKITQYDYRRTCMGNLSPRTTLETLFAFHNGKDRPLQQTMRSMSVSDVVITHRSGVTQTYYVDRDGFREMLMFPCEPKAPKRSTGRPRRKAGRER